MYRVFGMSSSGNCHKVKLLLEQLREPYDWQEVDIMRGESRTPGYLAMNPNGRVPLLQVGADIFLPESNAILNYLAEGSAFLPTDRLQRAQVLQWMFFEQYSHEPYVAVARFICCYLPPDHERRAELPRLRERGHQALKVMEQHLSSRRFFVGERYTIADIALFAYTHVADSGGIELVPYPAVRRWLEAVRSQPGYVAMPA
ncbi:MAG: glutathione S-transferase family protein [Gammaproteobacteria bacterium]|nr:glutathione S-transferase family protein [Gammaproteobacteria bacterium]